MSRVLLPSLLLLVVSNPAAALELSKFFKRSDQQAIELLEQEQFEQAASLFEDPQWRGVSQYRAGKYQQAMDDFSTLDESGLFNHGTAAARAGDYGKAVESLEAAAKLAPDNEDIKHNLEIAKKLKELSDNQEEQPQEGDEQSNQDESDSDEEQQEEQDQESNEQQSESQQQQPGEEPSDSDQQSESENNDEQNGGELSSDPSDSESDESQELDFSDLENEESDPTDEQEAQSSMAADTSVSEDDQATEQWLRRIPDDPSQLLRNKIRLNHMIEYPDVNHMQEPW